MKVLSGFILLNSVLTEPTQHPRTECPTECKEVRKMGLSKGNRPDCGIEKLYEKCQIVTTPYTVNVQLFHASATPYISFKSKAVV